MPLPLSLAGPGMVLPHLPSWGLVLNLGPMQKGEGVTLVSLSRALSWPDWPSASIQYPRAAAFSKLHRFPEICWNWQACQVPTARKNENSHTWRQQGLEREVGRRYCLAPSDVGDTKQPSSSTKMQYSDSPQGSGVEHLAQVPQQRAQGSARVGSQWRQQPHPAVGN